MSTVLLESTQDASTWQVRRDGRRPRGFACQVPPAPGGEPPAVVDDSGLQLSRAGSLAVNLAYAVVGVAAAVCLVWTLVVAVAEGSLLSPLV